MLQYEDINCKTIAILFCLFIIQLTVYNGTITRFIADDKVVYLLSVSEMRDAIGFRQQLSTTLFEAFELEITVNYPLHTWTENRSFMRNLTSWSVPFWLVTRRTRSIPLPACRTIVSVLWILSSRLSMLPTFQPLSGNSLSVFCAPFWQIEILNQNLIFLWNFHDFVEFLQIVRSRQFPKVK